MNQLPDVKDHGAAHIRPTDMGFSCGACRPSQLLQSVLPPLAKVRAKTRQTASASCATRSKPHSSRSKVHRQQGHSSLHRSAARSAELSMARRFIPNRSGHGFRSWRHRDAHHQQHATHRWPLSRTLKTAQSGARRPRPWRGRLALVTAGSTAALSTAGRPCLHTSGVQRTRVDRHVAAPRIPAGTTSPFATATRR